MPCYGGDFKKVVKIRLIGPPSFVYGDVELIFEDGSIAYVNKGARSFKPTKKDVEVRI